MEFCQRLLSQFKLRRGERKYLLKRVARCLLPKEIVGRRKKGFGVPLAKWLREVPAELPLARLPGVRTGFAEQAFAAHRSVYPTDQRLFLWSWLAAQRFQIAMNGRLPGRPVTIREEAIVD